MYHTNSLLDQPVLKMSHKVKNGMWKSGIVGNFELEL